MDRRNGQPKSTAEIDRRNGPSKLTVEIDRQNRLSKSDGKKMDQNALQRQKLVQEIFNYVITAFTVLTFGFVVRHKSQDHGISMLIHRLYVKSDSSLQPQLLYHSSGR
jgi:hypothetical protein